MSLQDDWNYTGEYGTETYPETIRKKKDEGKLCQYCTHWWYSGCDLKIVKSSSNENPCVYWKANY